MSYYQVSSGNGPPECELAVAKFFACLLENFKDLRIVQAVAGCGKGTFRSVYLATDSGLDEFAGTVKWICPSPYRPSQRRKNWFISFKRFQEEEPEGFDETRIVFQTMRSGGHGGQNVNKVETAVRAIYLPTGYSTVCQDERSQLMNKKRAVERIKLRLLEEAGQKMAESGRNKWKQHNSLKRGDAVAVFRGEKFQKG